MSLKEQILKVEDLPREEVHVDEWDLDVWVRSMTAAERDDYEQSLLESSGTGRNLKLIPNLQNAKAKLVARTLVEENGDRVFTDSEAGQLGGKAASAINKLYEIARRLSGISDTDVEEMVKNSSPVQGESSPTD